MNFSRIKFLISSTILIFGLTGCHSGFESKIEKKIVADSKTHLHVIFSLKDLTDFDWDKLYVFDPDCSKKEISQVLGFEYPYYKESCRILVFTEDDKIVYHEENQKTSKELTDGELMFQHPDSVKFKCYRYGQAFLRAEAKKTGKGTYFELIQID